MRNDRGAVLILTTFLLLVLVGATALAVDLGRLQLAKQRAQHICDASAIAAAWQLEPAAVDLGAAAAETAAMDLADTNNQSAGSLVDATVGVPEATDGVPGRRTITVYGQARVDYGFARLLGRQSGTVRARSTAALEPVNGFTYGFVPLAVTENKIRFIEPGSYEMLWTWYWNSSGGLDTLGQANNLYPIVFSDEAYDVKVYEDRLAGRSEPFALRIGRQYADITADVARSTCDSLNNRISDDMTWDEWLSAGDTDRARCSRVVVMPVVRRTANNMMIVGFTGFFIESVDYYELGGRHCAQLFGRFVPGIVGSTSIRWMQPFAPDIGQSNMMYRVRLTP